MVSLGHVSPEYLKLGALVVLGDVAVTVHMDKDKAWSNQDVDVNNKDALHVLPLQQTTGKLTMGEVKDDVGDAKAKRMDVEVEVHVVDLNA